MIQNKDLDSFLMRISDPTSKIAIIQEDDEVTSQRAQSRMGRPIGSITGGTKRAIDYKNKTFRISLKTNKLLQTIHKKTGLSYKDILEVAVLQYAKEILIH